MSAEPIPPELVLPAGVERAAPEHHWVFVIVTSKRTDRESRRFLEGERRTLRKLDLRSPEDVSSVALMCAACRLAPVGSDDMLSVCPGDV